MSCRKFSNNLELAHFVDFFFSNITQQCWVSIKIFFSTLSKYLSFFNQNIELLKIYINIDQIAWWCVTSYKHCLKRVGLRMFTYIFFWSCITIEISLCCSHCFLYSLNKYFMTVFLKFRSGEFSSHECCVFFKEKRPTVNLYIEYVTCEPRISWFQKSCFISEYVGNYYLAF